LHSLGVRLLYLSVVSPFDDHDSSLDSSEEGFSQFKLAVLIVPGMAVRRKLLVCPRHPVISTQMDDNVIQIG
jgi:hypothetical protein